jgi:diguanylate cyclase (GGDEF)-like protein
LPNAFILPLFKQWALEDWPLIHSYEFLRSVIDTITEHIVVIDRTGDIHFVNKSWVAFGQNNNCLIKDLWQGVNYLKVCDDSAAMGDQFAPKAAEGIRKVINAEQALFYFEYPCHSPDKKRWFIMRVTPFEFEGKAYYVISHQNITERKLIEEEILNLSRIDGLTTIPNRRRLDEFLSNEWLRCARLQQPITFALIDLDHFKLLNDTYGHLVGDECLRKIGALLRTFPLRPSDICGRYGGEEFAVVFGETSVEGGLNSINRLMDAIRGLKIPNEKSPTLPIVTASIGMATLYPDSHTHEHMLVESADRLLYAAKKNGRNQVAI